MTIALSCHDRQVTSPFGLLGNDENALTFALGYTMAHCPALLHRFLREIGIKQVRQQALSTAQILLQRHRPEGIADIEILVPGKLFVVIEAKIGLSVPTPKQCLKYLGRYDQHRKLRTKLVALVEGQHNAVLAGYCSKEERFRGLLTGLSWPTPSRFAKPGGNNGTHPVATDEVRSARQQVFDAWGPQAQQAMARGRALIIEVGSMGSWVAELLTRSGVGSHALSREWLLSLTLAHF